jgi:GT2 family glycosyltransferase
MENKVTFVLTSCGRFNFLKKCIDSFFKFNTYPIEKFIVVDNSCQTDSKEIINEIFKNYICNLEIIINEENIGQVRSIDKAYLNVDTPYIYHCEDDWEFIDFSFIEKSMDVLNFDSKIVNVNTRVRDDGEKGSYHPVNGPYVTNNGLNYYLYNLNYLNEWHGFSWNPGLRRLSDYKLIGNYFQYGNESAVGNKYKIMGYYSACLNNFYNKHIGTHSSTPKSNM